MPIRSSCKPTSLYRLEGGIDLARCLLTKSNALIDANTEVQLGDVTCHLVTGLLPTDHPTWSGHVRSLTGIDAQLPGSSPFGVLLVPLPPWTYALCWGAGHRLLDDDMIDPGFGILFGIRRLDPTRLGLVGSSALDASGRASETSVPGGSDLGGFHLEPYGDLVNRMAGTADLDGLTYHRDTGRNYRIRTGESLFLPLPLDPADLINDLRTISRTLEETDAQSSLRHAFQTRPIPKNHPHLPVLNERLAAALGGDGRFGPLGLAWPIAAVREANEAASFQVTALSRSGAIVVDSNIELDDLISQLRLLPITARLHKLETARIVACADDEGQEQLGRPISMRQWFVFETMIEHTRYCYQQGRWYRVGETFVEQIRDQVTDLLARRANLQFPVWTPTGKPDDEHRFCRRVGLEPGYLCLDRDLATTPFHPRLELCDLIGPGNELIHVKWLGRATAASHLYVQALASAEALRDEREAQIQLAGKVRALDPGRADFTPSTVVLAIAGRQWDVDHLFTLSQVNLLRLDRTVQHLQMNLLFADIPHTQKPNRRKPHAA